MKAWLIPISLVLLADTARADQCAWIDRLVANKANLILERSPTYIEFCEPCGDTVPGVPQVANDVTLRTPEHGYREFSFNGKPIDLAYIFVKTSDTRYENLAALAGCETSDVSPSLTIAAETPSGVLITAAADPVPEPAKPEPATIVTTIPAPAPPAPPPPQVYIYTTTTHEIAWFAVALAGAGGFITGAAVTLSLVTIRRRRAMRPRAMNIAPLG